MPPIMPCQAVLLRFEYAQPSVSSNWTEDDSRLYQQLAAIAVPDRAEQMAILLTLLPFGEQAAARVVELGCGEGRLSWAIQTAYPRASVVALDGSAEMRGATGARLDRSRARVESFELASDDWLALVDGADAVVSSLAIHHLDGAGKQRLFQALASRITGALLIADLVAPQRAEAHEVFAAAWDGSAQRQSADPRAFEHFQRTQWNIFHYPDPVDMPSPLAHQLRWLEDAGLHSVDCFWQRAGHAIYGGYTSPNRAAAPVLSFKTALEIAERALR
jgi:tRNA (cmo5U34)-methyltransferase